MTFTIGNTTVTTTGNVSVITNNHNSETIQVTTIVGA